MNDIIDALWWFFFFTWILILASSYSDGELKKIVAELYRAIIIVLMVLANNDRELRIEIAKLIGLDKLPLELWKKVRGLFDYADNENWWYPRTTRILKKIKERIMR